MGFCHVLNIIVIICVTLSISFSDGDFLVPDMELGDENLLAFNSPDSSLEFSSLPAGAFDPLFGESNNSGFLSSGDVNLDDSFQLAGCSASEDFPAIGKSRIRRNGILCPNSGAQPLTGAEPLQSEFNFGQEPLNRPNEIWGDSFVEERQNGLCKRITNGVMPWGVCYWPEEPLEPLRPNVVPPSIEKIGFPAFILDYCELGTSATKLCLG